MSTTRRQLYALAWLVPFSLFAQSPPPKKRPAPPVTGLRTLSTTIDPTTRDVTVKVENLTNKTVVGHAVVYMEFDQDGRKVNPEGAGVVLDHATSEPNQNEDRLLIRPGQIGSITGYHANPETVSVEATITGVVYEDLTAEGEASRILRVGRLQGQPTRLRALRCSAISRWRRRRALQGSRRANRRPDLTSTSPASRS